jgi:hypothetical protein
MPGVRLNLYQADREFQVEIGGDGSGYRLLCPKFDGSSRLIKSVILSDRDKEEIIGYVKPDAKAIEEERNDMLLHPEKYFSAFRDLKVVMVRAERAEEELADYKAANASIREELRCSIKERDRLKAENERLKREAV